jgi:hypothetical protein
MTKEYIKVKLVANCYGDYTPVPEEMYGELSKDTLLQIEVAQDTLKHNPNFKSINIDCCIHFDDKHKETKEFNEEFRIDSEYLEVFKDDYYYNFINKYDCNDSVECNIEIIN